MKASDSIASADLLRKFGFIEIPDPVAAAIGGGKSFLSSKVAQRYRRKLSDILANPTTRSISVVSKASADGMGQASAIASGDKTSVKVSVLSSGDQSIEIFTNLPDDLIESITISGDLSSYDIAEI